VATIPAGQPGRLGLLHDSTSSTRFLVDSGSVFSIIPYSSNKPTTGPVLMAADKTIIACWGQRTMAVNASGHQFVLTFLQAAVAFPILGADFLAAFDLKVDLFRLWLKHGRHQ